MVQSPSWEANRSVASQETRRISRNPKVHYRTHKRPPPVSTLGQPNPVHTPTSYLLEIHPIIIHPSTPRSPQWSTSLRFPHQDPIHPPLLTHTRHMPSPSHSSRFYHPHNIGWGVTKYTIMILSGRNTDRVFQELNPILWDKAHTSLGKRKSIYESTLVPKVISVTASLIQETKGRKQ